MKRVVYSKELKKKIKKLEARDKSERRKSKSDDKILLSKIKALDKKLNRKRK
jgi:hypothetical protein